VSDAPRPWLQVAGTSTPAFGLNMMPGVATRGRRLLHASSLPPLLLVAAGLIAWEIWVRTSNIPSAILPSPTRVAAGLIGRRDLFLDNVAVTMAEMLAGLVVGFIAGVAIAIAIVYVRFFERPFYPIVVTSQTIPIVALAPILTIMFGFGLEPKVIIVALAVFFPITINMVRGLRSTDPEIIALMRSYSATRLQIFRYVDLPASLPYLLAAVEIAVTYSVITAIIAEWPGAEKGLGHLMVTQNALSRTDLVLGAVVISSVVALVGFWLTHESRRVLIRWDELGEQRQALQG
jgi:ABC-type nitrate/sulfonate/bicarbonate transport system permease component